ncbi:unnamed protein product [Parascedosporium putredinis]|uniref:Mediator of RNA polymerase II transcription subunit 5 n=1 Tax=Parascedosporium putredinis TaxID=1442378 RepID=A0A9P1M5R1_9PEZI|nr:unnamed protein product [Parascedosporium putredinis]CAI7987550.1 unnamed protein product [Parascedosporium putredinis]
MASTTEVMANRDLFLRVQVASMGAWDDFLDNIRSPDALADLLLRPRAGNSDCLDPRIPLYLQTVLELEYIDPPAILKALYRYSTSHTQSQSGVEKLPPIRWRSSYSAEEVMFYRLTKVVVHGGAIRAPSDALRMMDIVARWMALFTAAFRTLLPTSWNASIAERLELFRSTLSSFEPVEKVKDGEEAKGLDEMLDSSVGLDTVILPELHITNSRAGLYIYLNACATPCSPTTPEFCITEALNQVDTSTFPTLSSMFDDSPNTNPLTDNVREEFCFACCLHNLMPQSHIETLLGENTYQTLPSGGRYVKEDLVRDCAADPEKFQSLIGELDNMDGNVGAVCQALTEVLTRELVLHSQLARKPLSLDVMLLFVKPASILQPICDLLDNWQYEEDQGEYQPVYEEFGSILLLLLAFAYRYNLTPADIGIRSRDSFVSKLLSQGHLGRPLDSLTEQEQEHLDGWIRGLFDTDTGDEQKAILKIFQLLLTPSAISTEASTMLTSVLNLVAKPLEHALRSYQRRDPKNVQIEPLLRTLKDNLALSRRTGGAEQNEVETWSGPATGGLAVTVKHTVASFIPWALHPRLNAMPTPYTHRQLLYGIKVLGAPRILRIILEELQQQTEAGNASIAFDIASALICAPDVTSDVLPAALQTLDESGNVPPTSATAQHPRGSQGGG